MFKKLLILSLFTLLLSCKNTDENVVKTTWISGQIINPTLDYIVFSKGSEILDTVKLDSNNFFLYKTDKIKAGLYNFKHNETQVFYVEPGDSLLMHVNTLDFDESLAYSGKGGEQNNLLMYLYLTNETENLSLQNWYALTSKEFTQKIDSLKQLKLKEYKDFITKNNITQGFKNAVLANINYDYFIKKERYAAANRNKTAEFDKNYFDYRKEISFELEELKFYYPYYRFMNRYFDNMVFSELKCNTTVDRNSYLFNHRKIQLIDSVVTSDSLRNILLRSNAMFYFLNAKNEAEEQKFFEEFAKMNTDEKQIEEVRKMFDITVKLNPGNIVPNVAVVNTDNTVKDLLSIKKAPTVIYFWSGKSPTSYKNIHNRAAELKSKYPEYDFLGINTDTHYKRWRLTINRNGYSPFEEFQIENLNEAEKKLLVQYMNSALILDKDGKILEGKINLFNTNIEELLLGFLNR